MSAVIIAYESLKNIHTPHQMPKPYTLIILGAIIIWKEISFRLVNKKSQETNSSSLKADAGITAAMPSLRSRRLLEFQSL